MLVAPGRVRGGDLAVSAASPSNSSTSRADAGISGNGGVSAEEGITDIYIDEIATRRIIIANSNTAYALADTNKLGSVAPHHVCELNQITAIITDRAHPPQPSKRRSNKQAAARYTQAEPPLSAESASAKRR